MHAAPSLETYKSREGKAAPTELFSQSQLQKKPFLWTNSIAGTEKIILEHFRNDCGFKGYVQQNVGKVEYSFAMKLGQ